jgi:hypothetical protein
MSMLLRIKVFTVSLFLYDLKLGYFILFPKYFYSKCFKIFSWKENLILSVVRIRKIEKGRAWEGLKLNQFQCLHIAVCNHLHKIKARFKV